MKTWEEIRAMWVNGERKEVYDFMIKLPEYQKINLIIQALDTAKRLNYQSGDLVDLREVLDCWAFPNLYI